MTDNAPNWPDLEFTVSREATINRGTEPDLWWSAFQAEAAVVMASTTIGGRLARAVATTAPGSARYTDEQLVASKRQELVAKLRKLAADT
jgi:anti-sigma factor RsiW